jgi:hypothetical protein
MLGDASVLISLDEAEQVFSKHLEDHADVRPVWPLLAEVVEELDDMAPARMSWIGRDDLLKEFDLIYGSLGVVWCRL